MSLAKKLGRPATMADVEALPADMKGEILDGELYVMPRRPTEPPRIEGMIGRQVGAPYDMGRGGPGGWWILVEPGIDLPGSPEVAPALAGWRRERLPKLPLAESIRVVPDWICEIHSPTTRGYDQLKKRRFYARHGVRWLWYVDPEAKTLIASRLLDGRWFEVALHGESETARVEPFIEAPLDLATWWEAG